MQLENGQVVAERYEVLGRVGSDANGEVYRVRDQQDNEIRALKVIHDAAARSPLLLETFRRQVRVARALDHPNLARVYELGDYQGSPFLVTELVVGESLAYYMARTGPISAEILRPIAGQICAALDFLHRQNIIHRDVKPAAFVFAPDGSLKLRDFGMARELDGQQTIALPGAASAHLSPEQLLGRQLDPRSDIYSAGRIFFELLAGRPPHAGIDVIARYTQPPPLVTKFAPDTPPHVSAAINRCLQPEMEQRFSAISEVITALNGSPEDWKLWEVAQARAAEKRELAVPPVAPAATDEANLRTASSGQVTPPMRPEIPPQPSPRTPAPPAPSENIISPNEPKLAPPVIAPQPSALQPRKPISSGPVSPITAPPDVKREPAVPEKLTPPAAEFVEPAPKAPAPPADFAQPVPMPPLPADLTPPRPPADFTPPAKPPANFTSPLRPPADLTSPAKPVFEPPAPPAKAEVSTPVVPALPVITPQEFEPSKARVPLPKPEFPMPSDPNPPRITPPVQPLPAPPVPPLDAKRVPANAPRVQPLPETPRVPPLPAQPGQPASTGTTGAGNAAPHAKPPQPTTTGRPKPPATEKPAADVGTGIPAGPSPQSGDAKNPRPQGAGTKESSPPARAERKPARSPLRPKPASPEARDDSKTLRPKIGDTPGKPAEVARTMLAVAKRLDEIQRAGNYHAPLTPGAIRLKPDGVEIDSAPPPEQGKTLVVSDSKYLAPECLFSRPVETKTITQSDIYSLGFISYEWLLGQEVFAKQFAFEDLSQSSFEWMRWHGDRAATVPAPAELATWIPAALSKLVQRMLSKDAAQRPASYEALIKELEDIRHRIEDTDHLIHVPSIEKIGGFGKSHGDKFSLSSLTRWPGILLVFLAIALVGALVGLLLKQ